MATENTENYNPKFCIYPTTLEAEAASLERIAPMLKGNRANTCNVPMNKDKDMEGEKFIQIGYTALRDPATGDFLPAVPLYIKAEDGAEEGAQKVIDDIGKLLAHRMKAYIDKCKEAGVEVG